MRIKFAHLDGSTPVMQSAMSRAAKNLTGHQRSDSDRVQRREQPANGHARVRDAVLALQASAGNLAVAHLAGAPLDHAVRADMEGRLGADLGHVRIHADPGAAERAREERAVAFARGADVSFAPDMYQPQTPAGRVVLAHELAHVVQQTRNAHGRALSPTHLEAEADAAAVGEGAVVGSATAGTVQRIFGLFEEEDEEERQKKIQLSPGEAESAKATLVPELTGDPQAWKRHIDIPRDARIMRLDSWIRQAHRGNAEFNAWADRGVRPADVPTPKRRPLPDAPQPKPSAPSAAPKTEEEEKAAELREKEINAEQGGGWRQNVAIPQNVPSTAENTFKAQRIIDGLSEIPEERRTALHRQIVKGGVDGLLRGVHFETEEERTRWQRELARKLVTAALEAAVLYVGGEVFAMVVPDLIAAMVGAEIEAGAVPAYTSELLAGGERALGEAGAGEGAATARSGAAAPETLFQRAGPELQPNMQAASELAPANASPLRPNMAPASDAAPALRGAGTEGTGAGGVQMRSVVKHRPEGQVVVETEEVLESVAVDAPPVSRPPAAPTGAGAEAQTSFQNEAFRPRSLRGTGGGQMHLPGKEGGGPAVAPSANPTTETIVDPAPSLEQSIEAPAAEHPEGTIGDPHKEEEVLEAAKGKSYPASEYGISSRLRKNTSIQRHEILQHSWLVSHGLAKTRGRGRSRFTTVLELPRDVHDKISSLQVAARLHDPAFLKNKSAREVIDINLGILRQAGVDDATRQRVLEDVMEMLSGIGNKAPL